MSRSREIRLLEAGSAAPDHRGNKIQAVPADREGLERCPGNSEVPLASRGLREQVGQPGDHERDAATGDDESRCDDGNLALHAGLLLHRPSQPKSQLRISLRTVEAAARHA